VVTKRYLQDTKWVKNALFEEEFQRFKDAVEFFKKYSDKYDFDWLMVAALAYQESRIDQSLRSPAGAVGVMQMLPATAKDPNVNIPNIDELEHNIHAGIKYLRFIRDRYFEKEPINEANKMLFTFASYNAGPARVAKLRLEAEKKGLDPNVWFRNVEIVAAKRIGRETVQYVSNIYKYYTAYRLIMDKMQLKKEAKQKIG
jgi:membrane-bound lytic murein transglycosylase MltF